MLSIVISNLLTLLIHVFMPANESRQKMLALVVLTLLSTPCLAQAPAQPDQASPPADPERWNLFYQATSIGQYHGTFTSPYEGPYSLQDLSERDVSLTTTLFFAFGWSKIRFLFSILRLRAVEDSAV